jgi:hypothetical protein
MTRPSAPVALLRPLIAALLALGPACAPPLGRTLPELSAAARTGDLLRMRRLLDRGADPGERDRRATGWPPLLHAIHTGQFEAAALLLERGASPDAASPSGYSALMMAVAEDEPAAVDLLIRAGANTGAAAANGMTALTIAVGGGLVDCRPARVRQLLGADPTLGLPDTAAGRAARTWAHLHAGVQLARNNALVPTVGAPRRSACGEVLRLLAASTRASAPSATAPGR